MAQNHYRAKRKQPYEKDWFLYLNMHSRLCRLNIREFCERHSSKSKVPMFEVVHDYFPGYPPSTIPTRMEHIIVGSTVYMMGGFKDPCLFGNRNSDVYFFDRTDPRGPSIRLCKGPISRLIKSKFQSMDTLIMLTLDDKLYVLAKRPDGGREFQDFRVFDPFHQSWKNLPSPLCLTKPNPEVSDHFFCGHKLFISTQDRIGRDSYIFDTRKEKWESAEKNIFLEGNKFLAFIEFEGFLIAVTCSSSHPEIKHEVVAYKLDSHGIPNPKSYQVLHGLGDAIFSQMDLEVDTAFLGKCDGNRMWLVFSGHTGDDYFYYAHTNVAVFKVSISNRHHGNPVISGYIEAQQHLNFSRYDPCYAAFAMLHY